MTSEVFNTDCLEYMRTLPDKAFQLAIADPPYGGAGNDISGQNEIRNCRGRFDKYKQIDCARTGGTWATVTSSWQNCNTLETLTHHLSR